MSGVTTGAPRNFVTFTTAAGEFVVEADAPQGREAEIHASPDQGFADSIAVGDQSRRSDRRTAQVIVTDQRRGMGTDAWEEQTGVADFTISDCDTRYKDSITCPPLATQVGPQVTLNAITTTTRLIPTGISASHLLLVGDNAGASWRWNTAEWIRLITSAGVNLDGANGVAETGGAVFVATIAAIYRSTDGGNYAALSGTPSTGTGYALGVHDGKLYWAKASGGVLSVHYTAEPEAATPVWVTAPSTFRLLPGETPWQLVEWRRPDNQRALYCLTVRSAGKGSPGARILALEDETQVWHEYHRLSTVKAGEVPTMLVHEADDNLYVACGASSDLVFSFNGGGGPEEVGPNGKGGIPSAERFGLKLYASNAQYLFGWADNRNAAASGRTLAMNSQRGWHTLYRPASGYYCTGAFVDSTLYTLDPTGRVYAQAVPAQADIPANATGREYLSGTFTHRYASTDLGTENVPKVALWSEVDVPEGPAPRVPAGATVEVGLYDQIAGTYEALGTITSAQTAFPVRFRVPHATITSLTGRQGYHFRPYVKLTRGTAATASPVVTMLALHARRQPRKRFVYTFAADFSANNANGQLPQWRGKSLKQIADELVTLAERAPLARVRWGTGVNEVVLDACEVHVAPVYEVAIGRLTATFTLIDMTVPASG